MSLFENLKNITFYKKIYLNLFKKFFHICLNFYNYLEIVILALNLTFS